VLKETKGLCVNCVNEKDCTLARKYPVWECEEHSSDEAKPKK